MEWKRDHFTVTDDANSQQMDVIHNFLRGSYWAKNIPLEIVKRALQHSVVFGLFDGSKQIGFARLVTDRATFAYLADVFVLDEYRGQGLGTFLMDCVMHHPDAQGLRRWMLMTRDAHALYRKFGWSEAAHPERVMEIHRPNAYQNESK